METDFVLILWRAKSWEFSAVVLLFTALAPLLSAQFVLIPFLNILMQSKPIFICCVCESVCLRHKISLRPPKNLHCLLGACAKLRKATVSFVTFVCLSVCLSVRNNSAPPGHIFMKFNILKFVQNMSRKFKSNEQFA